MKDPFRISTRHLGEVNALLGDFNRRSVHALMDVVAKYGSVRKINAKASKSARLDVIMGKLKTVRPEYVSDILWLKEQCVNRRFISLKDYWVDKTGHGRGAEACTIGHPVVLEISSLHYFPWLIHEAKQSLANRELMPGRFIRVRNMREQEQDGDLLAVSAAMQILGASWVETLDTKGTDGANVHLGGPDTITGYFGGIGEPNDYALRWVDEFLYYYTNYGIQEVLNVNPGTILLGYMLYRLGIDIRFKISVFMGNDNPYAALWTLIGAKLFSRKDGTTPLIGFNWSNSVNNDTLMQASSDRRALGFEGNVRFEHHILEAYRHIVRQPYDKRGELLDVAAAVPNISAKHEGGEIQTEKGREHQSSILDYFIPKREVEQKGLMPFLLQNYMDKHDSVNLTANALAGRGLGFMAARNAHQ